MFSKPIEPKHLFECLPSNLRPSSDGASSDGKSYDPQSNGLEKDDFTVPTIIPPMVLPLLHDLAQQMVKAGHQQQLFETYRSNFYLTSNILIETHSFIGYDKDHFKFLHSD